MTWHEKKKLKLSTNTKNVYSTHLNTCTQLHSTADNSAEGSTRYQYFSVVMTSYDFELFLNASYHSSALLWTI